MYLNSVADTSGGKHNYLRYQREKITHQGSDNPVVWHPGVVANRVDDPPGNPDGADHCGYDGVEEAGQEEDGEEEGDPLQGVLVHPLVAVEHLLRVAVHRRQLHLVLRPRLADQEALDKGDHVGGKDHEEDVAVGLVQQAGHFVVEEGEDGVKVAHGGDCGGSLDGLEMLRWRRRLI